MKEPMYDVAVIGGGASGMMAAGRAAELGAKVVLIEKNERLGKKLLITGGGRCNITHAEFDVKKLVAKYGKKGQFLHSAFAQFGVQDTFDFFESRGLKLKIEALQRAFPTTDKAESVFEILETYLKKGNVTVLTKSAVSGFKIEDTRIEGVIANKKTITAKKYILATGGKSHPETGSTGEGFSWLSTIGHNVIEPDNALVPITLSNTWVKSCAGTTLSDVRLSIVQNGAKEGSSVGKMLFTHVGISGPLVLNMSADVRECHKYDDVILELDLFPTLTEIALDKKILEVWQPQQNKHFKNSLKDLVPSALASTLVEMVPISSIKELHQVTREERQTLVHILKTIPLHVKGFLGADKAIVTSGGVALEEVDFKTMQSKKYGNLFLTGDILDFDRPSGGFSLQICWTTGYIAGESAAK